MYNKASNEQNLGELFVDATPVKVQKFIARPSSDLCDLLEFRNFFGCPKTSVTRLGLIYLARLHTGFDLTERL